MTCSMASSDRPFAEHEKTALLAEILKNSSVPSHILLRIIADYQVEPSWPDVVLPSGRTLRQCQNVLSEMRMTYHTPTGPPPPPSHPMYTTGAMQADPRYRPTSSPYPPPPQYTTSPAPTEISSISAPRQIQPRPPHLPPILPGPSRPAYTTAPAGAGAAETTRKRGRGRPKKADIDAERRAAEARGDVYPAARPSKRSKTLEGGARPSGDGSPTAMSISASSPQIQQLQTQGSRSSGPTSFPGASEGSPAAPPTPQPRPSSSRPSSRHQQQQQGEQLTMAGSPMDISTGPTSPASSVRDVRRRQQSPLMTTPTSQGMQQQQQQSPRTTSPRHRSGGMRPGDIAREEQQQQQPRDPFGIAHPAQPFGAFGSSAGRGVPGPPRSIMDHPPTSQPQQQRQRSPRSPPHATATTTSATGYSSATRTVGPQQPSPPQQRWQQQSLPPYVPRTTAGDDVMEQH